MLSFRLLVSTLAASLLVRALPTADTDGLHVKNDKLGAVASESALCSGIGIEVLKLGGNAADSTVATVLCVGVIGMYHSGIGGGGFMIARSSNGR